MDDTKVACGWLFGLWKQKGFDNRGCKSANDLSLCGGLLVHSMFVHVVSVIDCVWSHSIWLIQ